MESECNRGECFTTCCVLPAAAAQGSPPRTDPAGATNPRRDFSYRICSSIYPNTSFTNHESIPSSAELLSCLASALPQFLDTVLADNIRDQEYYHLSNSNRVCLDYIGQGLFSYSQNENPIPRTETASSSTTITDALNTGDVPFFEISHSAAANLHSYLLKKNHESELQAAMRRRIMRYMNLFEQDYSLVFTANQSSAFKLLADSYPFKSNQALLTVYDHENEAIEGMISSAENRGVRAQSAVFSWPNLRVNSTRLRKVLVNKSKPKKNRGLFVFPLHSRVTGSPYSYQWMNLARENGWHVLLDGCALCEKEMETLGLSLFQPDFLICSFYKVFGSNPTGFCCLFVKNTSTTYLGQSPVTMGIVNLVPPQNQFEQSTAIDEDESINQEIQQFHGITLNEHYEKSQPDSTTNTSEIECRALDHADTLGLILISSRIRCLVNWLVNALLSLHHPHSANGFPLVRIFGPKIKLGRGPAVAFNVYDWKGSRIEPTLVQKLADRNNISISCGFLKNMSFRDNYEEERENVTTRHGLNPENRKKVKRDLGFRVVSISIAMLSSFEDVYRFWVFVARFLDADFVEKERWRYAALNQTTVEV